MNEIKKIKLFHQPIKIINQNNLISIVKKKKIKYNIGLFLKGYRFRLNSRPYQIIIINRLFFCEYISKNFKVNDQVSEILGIFDIFKNKF